MEGPWPEHVKDVDAARILAIEALFDPWLSFKSEERILPDQIQHLACHCVTDVDSLEDSQLRFADLIGAYEVDLSLRQLGSGFMDLQDEGRARDLEQLPLIFLNACGSSVISPNTSTSFPSHFLQFRSRGVIGTEASIPDAVAAEFARYFYSNLLGGQTVGSSIYRARASLLSNRMNPLGLLYSYYGNPNLHVERAS